MSFDEMSIDVEEEAEKEFNQLYKRARKEDRELDKIQHKNHKVYCRRCYHTKKKLIAAKFHGFLEKNPSMCKNCFRGYLDIIYERTSN